MNAVSQALVEIDSVAQPPARVPVQSGMTPMDMVYHAVQSGQPIEVIREMMALSREFKQEQAREAFDEAVAAAKAEIPVVHRNSKGHNDKRYADFAAYAAVVDPIIGKYGLSYRFRTAQTDKITVTCILSHKAGHSEENSLSGPADASGSKNAIQAIGSSLTYLQRYTLIQALGLAASHDDDGKVVGQTADGGMISAEQIATIRALIEETGTPAEKFCEWAKIEAVPDLLARHFDKAVGALQARKAAK